MRISRNQLSRTNPRRAVCALANTIRASNPSASELLHPLQCDARVAVDRGNSVSLTSQVASHMSSLRFFGKKSQPLRSGNSTRFYRFPARAAKEKKGANVLASVLKRGEASVG